MSDVIAAGPYEFVRSSRGGWHYESGDWFITGAIIEADDGTFTLNVIYAHSHRKVLPSWPTPQAAANAAVPEFDRLRAIREAEVAARSPRFEPAVSGRGRRSVP